jgi:hypothetical protein
MKCNPLDCRKAGALGAAAPALCAGELHSILRLCAEEINAALQEGQTVKIDRLISLTLNMKVGGAVNISVRPDRGAVANLNNPLLWTAAKVANYNSFALFPGGKRYRSAGIPIPALRSP